MVLIDPSLLAGRDPVGLCRAAVDGGATMIQVRAKNATAGELLALTRTLVGAVSVPVLVNDRFDVALLAHAAGAHLGQDDVPLDAVRRHVPAGFVLGLSVGTPVEVQRAAGWPADYWSIGPCFATATKADAGAPLGVAGFEALARLAPAGMPVIGIGGVKADTAGAIVDAGAVGVAVIQAVLEAPDPRVAANNLSRAVQDGLRRRV